MGMSYEGVKWRETLVSERDASAPEHSVAPRDDRYDLATALRVVRHMETSAGRATVFEEIKRKNAMYRLVDAMYARAGSRLLQPLLLFLYMLKCAVSVGPFEDRDAEIVAISNFANEHHTVERVAGLIPEIPLLRLTILRRHIFAAVQLRAAFGMVGAIGRLWPFLTRLARAHSFMPSARIASALAFYMRLSQLFEGRPGLRAAIVTSNYSPEAVAMAAAAHRAGRRVVYANHAPVPANGAVVPPVLADCALFYGDATRRTYERRSRCTAEVALIGQPHKASAMQWRDDVQTVGIFLTSGTRTDVLSELIAAIRDSRPHARILVRNHPVALLKTDLSEIAASDANVEITLGNPLEDEIAACDMVICGNSGVALNVLSGGRPVAYLAGLDRVKYDSNGFVQSGLVCSIAGWSDDVYTLLKIFYQAPGWTRVMQSYDASYGADLAELHRAAAETLRRHIRPDGASDGARPTACEERTATASAA